jgi:serine/threonine protein kinase
MGFQATPSMGLRIQFVNKKSFSGFITYRARDTVLNSTVGLKVIGRKLAENPTARARFLREARAAAQIQHPNVARVIHYGEQDGECFMRWNSSIGRNDVRTHRANTMEARQALM